MVCGVVVEGALPGPVAVNLTAYCPGPLKVCVGFARVDVLFGPDAGSPKSQIRDGQSADVFVKETVLLLVQDQVNEALFGGASPITISSTANPSYALHAVPAPKINRKITLGVPARLIKVCCAFIQLPLPLPPKQLPTVGCILPDQPSLTLASPFMLVIGEKLNQAIFKQFAGSDMAPTFIQVAPRSVEY